MATSEVDTEVKPVTEYSEPGDHEKLSHYVDQRIWDIVQANLDNTLVQAQCGKWFHPVRDPKFPVCPECQAIVDHRSVD